MNFLTKYTYPIMSIVVFFYIIYFVYSQLTGVDSADPYFQFIINVATLCGILAVLEDRRKNKI